MSDRHTVHIHNDYADGILSDREKAEVDRHQADCPACRKDLNMITELKKRLSEIESPDPGNRYFSELTDKVLTRTTLPTGAGTAGNIVVDIPSGQQTLKTLIRVAAAITLLFGSFYASGFMPEKSQGNWADYSSPSGYLISDPIALPDAGLPDSVLSEPTPSESDGDIPKK